MYIYSWNICIYCESQVAINSLWNVAFMFKLFIECLLFLRKMAVYFKVIQIEVLWHRDIRQNYFVDTLRHILTVLRKQQQSNLLVFHFHLVTVETLDFWRRRTTPVQLSRNTQCPWFLGYGWH